MARPLPAISDVVWIPYKCSRATAETPLPWSKWLTNRRVTFQGDSQTRTLYASMIEHSCDMKVDFVTLKKALHKSAYASACLPNENEMDDIKGNWARSQCVNVTKLCITDFRRDFLSHYYQLPVGTMHMLRTRNTNDG